MDSNPGNPRSNRLRLEAETVKCGSCGFLWIDLSGQEIGPCDPFGVRCPHCGMLSGRPFQPMED